MIMETHDRLHGAFVKHFLAVSQKFSGVFGFSSSNVIFVEELGPRLAAVQIDQRFVRWGIYLTTLRREEIEMILCELSH